MNVLKYSAVHVICKGDKGVDVPTCSHKVLIRGHWTDSPIKSSL